MFFLDLTSLYIINEEIKIFTWFADRVKMKVNVWQIPTRDIIVYVTMVMEVPTAESETVSVTSRFKNSVNP